MIMKPSSTVDWPAERIDVVAKRICELGARYLKHAIHLSSADPWNIDEGWIAASIAMNFYKDEEDRAAFGNAVITYKESIAKYLIHLGHQFPDITIFDGGGKHYRNQDTYVNQPDQQES
jgi:hypothetical protein